MTSLAAIDPGAVSGAFAVFNDRALLHVDDLLVVDRMVDGVALAAALVYHRIDEVVVERVHSMPKQGVASSFRFGMGYGVIWGVVSALRLPLVLVAATTWKKHFALGAEKENARALAQRLYPSANDRLTRVRDVNRAEAILIGRWRLETRT